VVRNISSVLCSYFVVVLSLPGLLWMLHDFAVFGRAEPENPDESYHLHWSFKTPPQPTFHDITTMQTGGQGMIWSHTDLQGWTSATCIPSHAPLSNYFYVCVCVCVYTYIYIYLADTIKLFKASDW